MGEFLGAAGIGTLMAGLGAASSAADAALQYHYAKKMYQHRYRWAANDMRKAGFNPILAVNGGNVSGMASAPSTDFSGAVNSGMSAALNFAKTRKDMETADVNNEKTREEQRLAAANTENVNARTARQYIDNGILTQQEKALVEDAQARATNNRALADLNSARAEHAQFLADVEANIAASNRDIAAEKAGAGRYDTMRKAREYEIMPKGKEGIFWDRLDRASKAVGRGVNSALGLGKLKALSRAIR